MSKGKIRLSLKAHGLSIAICVIALSALASQTALSQYYPHTDPFNNEGWALLETVSDEFNDSVVDASKWFILGTNGDYRNHWKGRAPSQYTDANVREEGGYLTIYSKWDTGFVFADATLDGYKYGETAPITTGCLISENYFKYGYMEIRCKAADGPMASAFWSTGTSGELDVFEHYGHHPNKPDIGKKYHTSFHDWRKGSPTFGKRIWTNEHILDFRVADDFHVYGYEWDENYAKIYIDGKLVRCVTRQEVGDGWVVVNPQRVWLDCETFNWHVNPEDLTPEDFPGEGREYIIDYVRIWQKSIAGTGCDARENLVSNPGFETDMSLWTVTGSARRVTTDPYEGSGGLNLNGLGKVEQTIDLEPNTTYIASAWVKMPGTNMVDVWHNAYMGIKEFGYNATKVSWFRPDYTYQSIQFKTGETDTIATILFENKNSSHHAYADNFSLVKAEDLSDPEGLIPVEGIDIPEDSISIIDRAEIRLSPGLIPADATNRGLKWSSEDPGIVSVSGNGLITGMSPGSARVYVETVEGGYTDSCHVAVFTNYNLIMDPGFESGGLSWWDNSYGQSIVVKSDAHSGDFAGKLNGNGAVQKTITGLVPNTSYTLSCWGRVAEEGHNVYLGVSEHGNDVVNALFTETGYVHKGFNFTTGASSTSAKIWFWNGDAEHRVFCDDFVMILASDTIALEGISVSPAEMTLIEDESASLATVISPVNATYRTVTWESSNDSVALVDHNGLVTALKEGPVTITVRSDDNPLIVDSCLVTVEKFDSVPVSEIILSPPELFLVEGETGSVSATVLPDTATDKSITWESGDESIASVDQDGKVIAVSVGTTEITARSDFYKSVFGATSVTVADDTVHVTGINLTPAVLNLMEGDTISILTEILPEDATYKTITWESGNDSIASIDLNGLVSAIREGTVSITATSSENTTVSATASVTVFADTTINVGKFRTGSDFRVYPNPYSGGNLVLELPETRNVSIDIHDVTGKTVFSKSYSRTSMIILNPGQMQLPNGLYLIKCRDSSAAAVSKLIIQ